MNNKVDEIVKILNEIIEEASINVDMCEENLENLGLDSIAFVKTIIEIEDLYNIEIPDKYLNVNNMNTINKMVEVIEELTM